MDQITNTFKSHLNSFIERVPDFVEGAIILFLFMWLARIFKKMLSKRLESKTEDTLRARFISRVASSLIVLLGLMLAMKAAGYGDVAGGLLAGAGVSAFVIGFALKDIGENFLAGFLLSFSRPFRIDDTIEIEGMVGKVKALNLRDTHVKSFDGKDIFIPNATLIKNPLMNYTLDGYQRHSFELGVDYDTDFAKARDIIQKVLANKEGIASDHASSSVSYGSLGASTYNIQIKYWQDMFDSGVSTANLKTSLVEECLAALSNAGINMPGDIIELRPMPNVLVEKDQKE